MGAQTLWQRFWALGYNKSLEEVDDWHRGWEATFPQIPSYPQRYKKIYETYRAPLTRLGGGSYITNVRGRLRRPEVALKDGPKYLNFTQILNFAIQGICSDFLKMALINLYFLIK